jgi:hypothetical protein
VQTNYVVPEYESTSLFGAQCDGSQDWRTCIGFELPHQALNQISIYESSTKRWPARVATSHANSRSSDLDRTAQTTSRAHSSTVHALFTGPTNHCFVTPRHCLFTVHVPARQSKIATRTREMYLKD